MTDQGFGKRSSSLNYPVVGRGGKGVATIVVGKRTGPVAASFRLEGDDEIQVMTNSGQVVRMPGKNITVAPRNSMGVKIISTRGTEHVVSVEKVPSIDTNAEDPKLTQKVKTKDSVIRALDFDDTDVPSGPGSRSGASGRSSGRRSSGKRSGKSGAETVSSRTPKYLQRTPKKAQKVKIKDPVRRTLEFSPSESTPGARSPKKARRGTKSRRPKKT